MLCFRDGFLEIIVKHTNEKIRKVRPNYHNKTCVHDLDVIELKAFIGILYYTAIFKENRTHYSCWYSTDGTGRDIYRCVMSKNRFEVLLNCLRFDDASTREERRNSDLAAPISQLFSMLIQNFKEVCSIGSYACIDEMLVAFRGLCLVAIEKLVPLFSDLHQKRHWRLMFRNKTGALLFFLVCIILETSRMIRQILIRKNQK